MSSISLFKPWENGCEKFHEKTMNIGAKHRNEMAACPYRHAEWMIFKRCIHQHDEQDEKQEHWATQ